MSSGVRGQMLDPLETGELQAPVTRHGILVLKIKLRSSAGAVYTLGR